jgi:hypothetical protein
MTESRRTATLLLAAAAIYLPLTGLGFGTNIDSQFIADTGRKFMATGVYTPSRYPGFPVYEMPAAVLAHVGGATLSNLGTVGMSLLGVYAFLRILRRLAIPHETWLAIALIGNPLYWNSSTYTIDYVWSLSLTLCGFALLVHDRILMSGILFGLATGSRATSIGLAFVVLLHRFVTDPRARADVLKAAAITVAIAVVAYVPTLFADGFLKLYFGEWNAIDYAANFGYGNLTFIGPPAALLLLAVSPLIASRIAGLPDRWRLLGWLCLVVIVGYEALFLRAPLQVGYLLPALPCMLMLLGMTMHDRPRLLASIVVLSVASSILSINVMTVTGGLHRVQSVLPPVAAVEAATTRGLATGVSAGVFVRWGYVVSDAYARWQITSASKPPG